MTPTDHPLGTRSTCKVCHSTLMKGQGGWFHVYGLPVRDDHEGEPDLTRVSYAKVDETREEVEKEQESQGPQHKGGYDQCKYLPRICCQWFQEQLMEGGILTYQELWEDATEKDRGKLAGQGVFMVFSEDCPWGPKVEQIEYCPKCGRCIRYVEKGKKSWFGF